MTRYTTLELTLMLGAVDPIHYSRLLTQLGLSPLGISFTQLQLPTTANTVADVVKVLADVAPFELAKALHTIGYAKLACQFNVILLYREDRSIDVFWSQVLVIFRSITYPTYPAILERLNVRMSHSALGYQSSSEPDVLQMRDHGITSQQIIEALEEFNLHAQATLIRNFVAINTSTSKSADPRIDAIFADLQIADTVRNLMYDDGLDLRTLDGVTVEDIRTAADDAKVSIAPVRMQSLVNRLHQLFVSI